jgi:hypothetical protein
MEEAGVEIPFDSPWKQRRRFLHRTLLPPKAFARQR